MILRLFRVLLLTFCGVVAYPGWFSCDYSCMAGLSPGDAFGQMGVSHYESVIGTNCAISTNIPSDGYTAGQSYDVTITSTLSLGMKVACDQGDFSGQKVKDTSDSFLGQTTSHTWTANTATSTTFRALCGAGGSTDKVFIGAAVSVSKASGSNAGPTTTASPDAAQSSDTTVATTKGLELLPGMTLSTTVANNNIDIRVVVKKNTWVSIGLSNGKQATMNGGGEGVDLFACTDGAAVQRYWQTTYSTPSNAIEEVSGSSCARISGETIMTFQRPVSRRLNSVAIRLGSEQPVIFAHGSAGITSFHKHPNDARGGKLIDFQTLTASDAPAKGGEAALYLHLIFMILSWGALLPWGVALANRTRENLGYPAGAWLKLHIYFQIAGWFAQLVGFVMALWHVSANIGTHFQNGHTVIGIIVVVVGTLQPANALLRPHKPEGGEAKSVLRWIWEITHKGVGYTVVIMGILNIWYGVKLLEDQGYDGATKAIAISLALIATVPILVYIIASLFMPTNPLSTLCIRFVANGKNAKIMSGSYKSKADPVIGAVAD